MKRKPRDFKLILIYCFSIFIGACIQKPKRNFFQEMKVSYPDLKFDSDSYFIGDFGLSSNSHQINGNDYWKLNCKEYCMFYLTGFIRIKENVVLLIPLNYTKDSLTEYKLFDFSEKKGSSWEVFLRNGEKTRIGDSIIYTGSYKENEDTIFRYSIHPFDLFTFSNTKEYKDLRFKVEVSKRRGILNISCGTYKNDTLFFAYLYPKAQLIDKSQGQKLL